tara:strand:- start:154 stop:414 length:261 start_codon:yes stop_codon:yes gene_type:complete
LPPEAVTINVPGAIGLLRSNAAKCSLFGENIFPVFGFNFPCSAIKRKKLQAFDIAKSLVATTTKIAQKMRPFFVFYGLQGITGRFH